MSITRSTALPLYTCASVKEIERRAAKDHPDLMERAGRAAADLAHAHLMPGARVLVLCGSGNNGGDGFVAARYLREAGHDVHVVFAGSAERQPPDAKRAYARWKEAGGSIGHNFEPGGWSFIIDALVGIGLTSALRPPLAELVDKANAAGVPILALDVPSGLQANSGHCAGSGIRAFATLTFISLKPGLFTADGVDLCGVVHCDTLSLDAAAWLPADGWTIGLDRLQQLPPRPRNSHKGTFGSVAVLGGNTGMRGAAILAARAALRSGAGRVYLAMRATPATLHLDPLYPEIMLQHDDARLSQHDGTWVAGPGLGLDAESLQALAAILPKALPLVLDADALTLLATIPHLRHDLVARSIPAILTPHPKEAARLLATSVAAIQENRITAAQRIAQEYHAVVALKGAGTVFATPDGAWSINLTGNPGLSTAGTGDVLAGLIGALLAQGLPPPQAAALGVYVHGLAADHVADTSGMVGMTASDVIEAARAVLNRKLPL